MKKTFTLPLKLLISAAAALFLLNAFTSCGSTPAAPEEITIIEEDQPPVKYTEEYNKAKIYLIADGSQRIVKLDSTKEAVLSVFESELPKDAMFRVQIFSGNKTDKESGTKLLPEATITVSPDDITKFADGYDLMANAADFGSTAKDLDKALCAKETYFAEATVYFTTKEAKGVTFGTKLITSNNTVYTPAN